MDVIKNSGIVWNEETFEGHIKILEPRVAGTKMIFRG
jgi:hypothetical protein